MFRSPLAATCSAATVLALSGFLIGAASTSPAHAAEVKLLGPLAMRAVFADIMPQFEKASGHKVTADLATIGVITDRLTKGEAADVAIVSGAQNEALQKLGKLVAGSRVEVARVGYSAFVRKGTPKPDLGSADALKRTLLAAKSIAYGDPAGGGPSGIYMAGLMQRLGIAAEVKAKTKLLAPGGAVTDAVVKGEVEIAFSVNSDGVTVAGLDTYPLPAEVQSYTLYAAGIVAGGKQADAAKALIAFLATPAAKQAMTAKGFEPR